MFGGGTTTFGSPSAFGAPQPTVQPVQFGATNPAAAQQQPQVRDFEVTSPPDDSVSCLEFSPGTIPQIFLIAGSWDNQVRCWEVDRSTGKTVPKSMQSMTGPVLDVCWSDEGSKVFMASCDKAVKCWDLGSNSVMQVAQHDAPVKSCHWVKAPNYTALMTSSWDKTIRFWDTRTPNPILSFQVPERCYCVDVDYPMAVVGVAGRGLIIYRLDNTPVEVKRMESPLKYQHRCVSIFKDKQNQPTGFALGSVEGRVAIQYVNPIQPKDNFTFKCHRSNGTNQQGFQDIYAVNDIKFHPSHGTLATVGSDGRYCFWDKDARTKLKTLENPVDQPITCCAFNADGQIFAYAVSYDWSKGHEYYNPQKKPQILLHPCFDDLKPRDKR
uniref:Mitotic checkpoint protein and poly(A)+ RNA export protein n=1 Tax=Isotomurus palustris TaxID=36144 RepID=A0A481SYY3_9HEXA|nr:mitotic checkpoint protein and poly(a)+ RNA export protein [Isotomurus palustris]